MRESGKVLPVSEHASVSRNPNDSGEDTTQPTETKKAVESSSLERERDKDGAEVVRATVMEALPNTMFKVELSDTNEEILSYLSGRMRKFRIRVLVGDEVRVKLDPYGGKARIITRL